jgi:hypothetical protein
MAEAACGCVRQSVQLHLLLSTAGYLVCIRVMMVMAIVDMLRVTMRVFSIRVILP